MVVAFALPAVARDGGSPELRRLMALNRFAVTPALACVWLLGITLATKGGWFAAPWLQAKIGLVVLLSAIHGIQSGRLRRLSRGAGQVLATTPWWPLIVAGVIMAIIGLAADKPALWG